MAQPEADKDLLETLQSTVSHLEKELETAKAEQAKLEKKLKKAERDQEIADRYNESLREEVNSLRKQLHGYKSKKYADCGCQTEIVLQNDQKEAEKDAGTTAEGGHNDLQNLQEEGQSIAESLKSTAEAALSQSGFVFDEQTGFYYDYNTGYYYDSKNQLYYDANTGIYYYYNQHTKSYEFHAQVAIPEQSVHQQSITSHGQEAATDRNGKRDRKKTRRKTADNKKKKSKPMGQKYDSSEDEDVIEITDEPDGNRRGADRRKVDQEVEVIEIDDSDDSDHGNANKRSKTGCSDADKSDDSEMEEGEISDSSRDASMPESESESSTSAEDETEDVTKQQWPPCVRLIVTESECLRLGTLFIVTCMGGTVGREETNPVCIAEEAVSKKHAEIGYNEGERQYWIKDTGSQNGTMLNGNQLISKAREESECSALSHGDTVTMGTTVLRVHIHPGDETCDDCEPGQVQAVLQKHTPQTVTILSKEEREKLRKKQLKQIKKRYMLAGADYEDNKEVIQNPHYADRAEQRRKTVGSDNPHQKDDLPASVNVAIADSNVGHKMLKKMGWKEGQLLGKHEQGLDQPIQVVVRDKNAGLGSGTQRSMDEVQYSRKTTQHWNKARDRFQEIGTSSTKQPQQRVKPQRHQWIKGGVEVLGENESNDSEQTKKERVTNTTAAVKEEKIFDI
ncbi:angiogenic factor with G patch and FHA domains 1-like isoform X1 [Ptychodera flava]|uniref:angiogenic factor with G patch and FHA domains 1-like isoform X1 n=1 Tax=Ptychodera flava TaxID=63121 RepID=UPI003969F63C